MHVASHDLFNMKLRTCLDTGLCEKDEEGASQYYSVQEFGLHKKINIANAYRAGKLGAKPYLGSTDFVRVTQ